MADVRDEQEAWDARYREHRHLWSGNPNDVLVREVSDVVPGRALDLGCGEGGDAIWLARRGWSVTAVDISPVALERARGHAVDAGAEAAARIDWQHRDLTVSFPPGEFDLVSTHFLHSMSGPVQLPILRGAVAAVAPGGVLLIVGHAGVAHWVEQEGPVPVLPTPDEVIASLDLEPDGWELLVASEHERRQAGPDGVEHVRTDNAVKLRRR